MPGTESAHPQHTSTPQDGIALRPLTFLDTMHHTGVLVQAMMGHDIDFQILERSRATYLAARWVALPLYYQLGCVGYGAFEDGALAGMLYLSGWRQALHVEAIAVHPDHRRQGVGRALLDLAERQARELGRRWLSLRVTVDNERAVQLYEAVGFRRTHHRKLHVSGRQLADAVSENGLVRLRPLVGPGARVACLNFARVDLSEGDAWAADILAAQSASLRTPPSGRHWLCETDGRSVGYLALRESAKATSLYLATHPDWWGSHEERMLLGLALARLRPVPEVVEVQLASWRHHEATAHSLASLSPTDKPVAKMTMLKALASPADTPEEEGHHGR